MSIELLNELEKKVHNAVDTIDLLKMEIEELREAKAALLQEKEEWEGKLERVLELLGSFESTAESEGSANAETATEEAEDEKSEYEAQAHV